jgi:hypothetical protein
MGDTKKEVKKDKPEIVEFQKIETQKAGIKNISGQLVTVPYDYKDTVIGKRKIGRPQKYLILQAGQVESSVNPKVFDSPAYKKFEKEGWIQRV